jgi:hypothetical protein
MVGVIAFSGHRFLGDSTAHDGIAAQMAELTERHRVAAGYGSLAGGADILWAETLVARGAELHVVLPFDADRFLEVSVRSAGVTWETRFRSLFAATASVHVLEPDASRDDDASYGAAASRFQADAVARARTLDVVPRLQVVWDGRAATGDAGAAADVERWRRLGLPLDVIPAAP